ncbi:Heat-labile enterotoxin, A chain [Metarhizium guizhouense ARSEF 977]|uniref:Heat-labile enterotoxin, A chain n=1 Tax=Metarhizium guizhouense (strain ARSEF 977) TaxID=1276136 RepID=A0A0B4GIM9_METGA|nr:Heat-labile enterotoxin, A chain [Metarhizium guizhouense ARSEF 977]
MQYGLFLALSALLCLQEASAGLVPAPSTLDNTAKDGVIQRRAPPRDPLLAAISQIDGLANWLTRAPIRNDCFFVTTAKLTGASVEDISRAVDIKVPPPKRPGDSGRDGIAVKEMVKAFDRLGLKYKVWSYNWFNDFDGRAEALAMPPKGLPKVVGVAYRRPDGSGHVVVCRLEQTYSSIPQNETNALTLSKPGTPYRRYLDYQASPQGTDVTADVRQSRIFAYFHIDPEASQVQFTNNLQAQIAAMEREATQFGEPMEVEPFYDEELALLSQGAFKNLNCQRALQTVLFKDNPNAKRSIEDGNSLQARADEDCQKAREKTEELTKEDQKAAKQETEKASNSGGEEGTAGTPKEEDTTKLPEEVKEGDLPKALDDAKGIELTQKTSDDVFTDLFSSQKMSEKAAKLGVKVEDARKRLSGYEPLTKESPKLKLSGAKLAGEGAGVALWVTGMVQAFTSHTTGLERASAVTAIIPFVGCGFSALSEADTKEGVDVVDKMMCIYADILLLTPLAPFSFVVQVFRGIMSLYKPKALPKAEEVQDNRDKRWARFLDDKVFTYFYSDDSVSKNRAFRDKLNGTLFADNLAVVSDAADFIAIANTSAKIALQAQNADKAKIQAGALDVANQIREGISPMFVRRQRDFLLKLPQRIQQETKLSLQPIAEQFNKELIEHITSEAMVREYTPLVPAVDGQSLGGEHLEDQVRGSLRAIGDHLKKTPPPLPKLFDIAYVLGQSKGMLDINPLSLIPGDFIKSRAPDLSQDDVDFYALHHALQISLLLRGKLTEDKLSKLWPSDDANTVQQLQLLLALKFGKIYDEQKVLYAKSQVGPAGTFLDDKVVRFHTHPNIPPHGRDEESMAYLGLILDLSEERIKTIPRQQEVIGFKDLGTDEKLITAMLEHAKELYVKKVDAEAVAMQDDKANDGEKDKKP